MSNDYDGHAARVCERGANAEVKSCVESEHGGTVWLVLMQLAIVSSLITSCVFTTQADDDAKETRTQSGAVAVDQRRAPGTSPRFLLGAASRTTVVLAGHTERVWHAAFNPDGNPLVTASDDRTARFILVFATTQASSR